MFIEFRRFAKTPTTRFVWNFTMMRMSEIYSLYFKRMFGNDDDDDDDF